MNDLTPVIGATGTGLAYYLGQSNDLIGLFAGILTCAYLICKLVHLYKNGKE